VLWALNRRCGHRARSIGVSGAPRYDEAESTVARRWRKRGPHEMNDADSGSFGYGEDSMTQARARRHQE
jgi:hypothetical protein